MLALRPLTAALGGLVIRMRMVGRAVMLLSATMLSAGSGSALEPAAGAASPGVLDCSPRVVDTNGLLKLTMRVPHGGYLGVREPRWDLFLVIYPVPEPGRPPLMPSEEFRLRQTLELPVATLHGARWVVGHDKLERVFARGGRYTILLSESLESEDIPVFKCHVEFRPSPTR